MPTTRRTLMMALNFAIASLDAETPGPRAGRKGMPYLRLELDGLSQRSHCCCREPAAPHQQDMDAIDASPGISYAWALGSLTPLGLLHPGPGVS